MESLGFYQEDENSAWFVNADYKRLKGPPAIQLRLDEATSLPIGVVRLYLIKHNVHPDYLDDAIAKMGM